MTDSPPVDDDTFEAILEQLRTLVSETVQDEERPADALTTLEEEFAAWYEDPALEFGTVAVSHSLEDAGIPREDRMAITDSVVREFDVLERC